MVFSPVQKMGPFNSAVDLVCTMSLQGVIASLEDHVETSGNHDWG